ncbi:MAG: hypothetical protein KC620_07880 [Myxococcales bacterium]|nr:hypothetical protein [Myxococcales bacterium]
MKTSVAVAALAALAALALALTATAQAAEPVRAWQGARTVVKDKHLIPAMKDGEGYGDKYTFNADFGDRGSFYFSLTISNLGLGDHKMEAKGRLSVDGKEMRWDKDLDEDDWSYAKDKLLIKAGPATLSGTPDALRFQVDAGGNALDFTFTPIARAWRPRNGQVQFGKDRKVSDYTVFPLMTAKGKFKIGGDWQEIEGRGYGTRSWSEMAVYEQSRWALDMRGIEGDTTVYMREIGTTDEYGAIRVPYLLITKGDQVLVESFDYQFKPTEMMTDDKHENAYRVPEGFTLAGKDAEAKDVQFRGKVTKKKLLARKDPLGEMNAALRAVAERYSKPVRYEYEVDYLIEVKTANGVERIGGTGRYEVYHLNK